MIMRLTLLIALTIAYARCDDDDVQLVQSVKGGFGGGHFQYNPTANQFRFYENNTKDGRHELNGSHYGGSQTNGYGSYGANGYQGTYGSSVQTNGFGQNGYGGASQNHSTYGQGSYGAYGASTQSQNNGYNQGALGVSSHTQSSGQNQGSYGISSQQTQNNGLNQGTYGVSSQNHHNGYNQGSYGLSNHGQNGQTQGTYGQNGYNQGNYGSQSQNNGYNQGSYGSQSQNGYNQGSYGVSFLPQNGYGQGNNLVASQTPNSEVGVCYIEVPTASLVLDPNPKNLPKGNGSRPELSRIRTCCKGYERNIYNPKLCDPVCSRECVNGLCIAPEVCSCFQMHTINRGGYCVATCPIGCQNGRCEGGECMCRPGFQLDAGGLYCVPVCHNNCGGTGNCTAPNICSPNVGPNHGPNAGPNYGHPVINQGGPINVGTMHIGYNQGCQNCLNGDCISNVCHCHKGYTTGQSGQCVPQCQLSCGPNSRCVAPDTCAPDYQLSPLPQNNPHESRPQGLYPILPSPYPGQNPTYTNTQGVYGQNSNYSNSSFNSSSQASSHHESQDSYNAWSQSNKFNSTNTNYDIVGYDNQNQLHQQVNHSVPHQIYPLEYNPTTTNLPVHLLNSSYPHPEVSNLTSGGDHSNLCSKPCINGVCIGINRCSCFTGYTLDTTDVTETKCIPHCPGGCPNGVCSSPNLCLCNVGYHKDYSVKGRTQCVKRIR